MVRRLLTRFRTAARDERGAITALVLVLMPALLFAAALAIDLSDINAQRRHTQAQADLAALSAARNLHTAQAARAAARATVVANDTYPAHGLADDQIVFGRFRGGRFLPLPDQSSAAGAEAVQVTVRAPVDVYLLGLFMDTSAFTVVRSATAAVETPRISFALGNCLASLRLLRPILEPLIPVGLDVLCSGRGIDAEVALFPELTELAARFDLLTPSGEPATYGDVLDAELPVSAVLETLLGRSLPWDGRTVRLGDAIVLAEGLDRATVGAILPSARIQLSDLVLATAELLAQRVADVRLGVDLGAAGTVQASLAVGDPRRIVVGMAPGDPEAYARTAQIELRLPELSILNLFKLRLRVGVANASARLTGGATSCSVPGDTEVAVFDPVDANLIEIEMETQVLGLPNGHELLGLQVDTVEDRQTRRIAFTRSDYEIYPTAILAPTGQYTSDTLGTTLRRGVSDMLERSRREIDAARAAPSCSGLLGCVVGGLTASVRNILSGLSSSLVGTVANVLNVLGAEGTLTNAILSGIVGLDLARAELTLLDIGCGAGSGRGPRLVL